MAKRVTKKQWADALDSGKYLQGQYCLRNKDDCFCCLGVYCDLAGVEWEITDRDYIAKIEGTQSCTTLPQKIKSKFTNNVINHLMGMNDGGESFHEIADWIRTHNLKNGDFINA